MFRNQNKNSIHTVARRDDHTTGVGEVGGKEQERDYHNNHPEIYCIFVRDHVVWSGEKSLQLISAISIVKESARQELNDEEPDAHQVEILG